MRFLLVALLWLITLGTGHAASAETPEELTRQCQKGKAGACVTLGRMYYQGKGVTQDAVKAVALFRKACDGQNAIGCANLGVMYKNGTGVRQSDVDALTFVGKACELGGASECKYYAEFKTGKT